MPIPANSWGFGEILSETGVIGKFKFDSNGDVTALTDWDADMANANTDAKICLYGEIGGANKLVIKNRHGATRVFMINSHYSTTVTP